MAGAYNILCGRHGPGDNVHFHFQAHAGHAQGVGNAALVVHNVLLRQNVDNFTVGRDGHGAGRVQGAFHIALRHLAAFHGNDPMAVDAHDVAAGNAHIDRMNFAAGHKLRVLHRLADGLNGLLNIDHYALAQPSGNTGADAHHVDETRLSKFPDHRADLGRADIEANDELGLVHAILLKHLAMLYGLRRRFAELARTAPTYVRPLLYRLSCPCGGKPHQAGWLSSTHTLPLTARTSRTLRRSRRRARSPRAMPRRAKLPSQSSVARERRSSRSSR